VKGERERDKEGERERERESVRARERSKSQQREGVERTKSREERESSICVRMCFRMQGMRKTRCTRTCAYTGCDAVMQQVGVRFSEYQGSARALLASMTFSQVCACACACVRVSMRACVRTCLHFCMCAYGLAVHVSM